MKLSDQLKAITAASIGGGLEMDDFVVYIFFFAPILAKLFFPPTDHFISIVYIRCFCDWLFITAYRGGVLWALWGSIRPKKRPVDENVVTPGNRAQRWFLGLSFLA